VDKEPLVDTLVEDGRRLIERLVEEGIGVKAACWLYEAEEGKWFLSLATPLVGEDEGTKEAYRRVLAVMRRMPEPFWIGTLDVKLISPQHPIARAVQDFHRRHTGPSPIHYDWTQFGGLSVEGVYVYPPAPVR
jgi:hypothetical protein